jgi:protein-S-isoprenylcysteine O-methyltransferase Ste14
MRSLVAAYTVIGLFITLERRLRADQAARSMQAEPADQGTTRLVGAVFGFALSAGLLAPVLSRWGVGRIASARLASVGLAFMLAALATRVWAARTLGRFYTRTLRTAADQTVIRSGPYRFVRHPGYAADLLLWLGFGLAARNWLVTGAISAAMWLAYARRIRAEEAMLIGRLGEPYQAYMRQTWRLVPGIV